MKSSEFVTKLVDIATNYKTLYVLGCFGAPMTDKNKVRYTNNQTFNGKPYDKLVGYNDGKPVYVKMRTPEGTARMNMIMKANKNVFGFDCVCLIKGVLWGWNGDSEANYGGAGYCVNGVPDIGADTMMNRYCKHVSKDFSTIKVGEAVWISGHIGVYIGDGKVVECTPKWDNKVQITNLGNVGNKNGNYRMWTLHGELPWIEYDSDTVPYKPTPADTGTVGTRTYIVKKGDVLSKIAKEYGTTVDRIVSDNAKSHKTITPDHIVVGWKLKVQKGDNNMRKGNFNGGYRILDFMKAVAYETESASTITVAGLYQRVKEALEDKSKPLVLHDLIVDDDGTQILIGDTIIDRANAKVDGSKAVFFIGVGSYSIKVTVTVAGALNADYYEYAGGASEVSDLSDLDDIELTNLSNGQILKYNSTTGKWENANGGGGGASNLSDLGDVVITDGLSDGQILRYNAEQQKWYNRPLSCYVNLADASNWEFTWDALSESWKHTLTSAEASALSNAVNNFIANMTVALPLDSESTPTTKYLTVVMDISRKALVPYEDVYYSGAGTAVIANGKYNFIASISYEGAPPAITQVLEIKAVSVS